MLKKLRLVLSLCLLLLVLAVPAVAQENGLPQQIELPDGFTISVPANWTQQADTSLGGTLLEGTRATARVFTPAALAAITEIDASAPLADILVILYRDFAVERARESQIEALTLGDHPAASYRYSSGAEEGLFIVVDFGAGAYGLFEYVAASGLLDEQLQLAKSIATTFAENIVEVDPKTGLPQAVPAGAATPITTAGGAACLVSTTTEGTAALHVGPGENRAIVSFLPPIGVYTVTGRFVLEDGSEWFQLNKDEIPSAAVANEVWLARALVDEQGDCDAVANASEPPIIPNSNIPPLEPSSEQGESVAETTVPVEGGLLPTSGSWTLTFAPTTPVSCLDTETVHIESSQLWDTTPFVARLITAPDGSTFVYGANTFTRSAPSTYSGSFTFEGGANTQVRFDVISGSEMLGQVVYNETVNGRPCSATGTLYVHRN